MDENTELEVERFLEADIMPERGPLTLAEDLIAIGELDRAQKVLDKFHTESGRKYYIQSSLYKKRKWYSEQRKQLKLAVKAEPDNEEYKKELAELEEFSKTKEYKSATRKRQMGEAGGVFAECCIEGLCYCICEGICEGIGSGC